MLFNNVITDINNWLTSTGDWYKMEYNAITLFIKDFKSADAWQHILDNAKVPTEEQEDITMIQFTLGGHIIWE